MSYYKFQNNIVFRSEDLVFILTKNVDSDEMPNASAFHLGLHCLKKMASREASFGYYMGLAVRVQS